MAPVREPPMSFPREIKLASVRKLRPNKRNPRTHSKKQIDQIVQSIRRFGWTCPIIVDEDGVILAGFARYLAAKKSGLKQVPVIVVSGLSTLKSALLRSPITR